MKEYQVEVVETLIKIVTVEADSIDEAIANVMDDYNNAEIVLNADDFLDVEFNLINKD